MTFKTGDTVQATSEGRTVTARVIMASPNGKSLAIQWDDGMLAGHCGLMPIYQNDNGHYFSLFDHPVTLAKVESAHDRDL